MMESKRIKPDQEGLTHLLLAIVKGRSIAAEGGYLEIMGGIPGIPDTGLEPWLADDRTVTLLSELVDGRRIIEPTLWLNLAFMVDQSKSWDVGLYFRGIRMPTPEEAMEDMRDRALWSPQPFSPEDNPRLSEIDRLMER